MARLRLLLRPWERTACAILNVVPLPGVGAMLVGWRNAHTRLLRNGVLQAVLVLFGSWPLIVPGLLGVAWAAWDTARIAQADLGRLPPREAEAPKPSAPPKATRR
jgi:hypothetical protein